MMMKPLWKGIQTKKRFLGSRRRLGTLFVLPMKAEARVLILSFSQSREEKLFLITHSFLLSRLKTKGNKHQSIGQQSWKRRYKVLIFTWKLFLLLNCGHFRDSSPNCWDGTERSESSESRGDKDESSAGGNSSQCSNSPLLVKSA